MSSSGLDLHQRGEGREGRGGDRGEERGEEGMERGLYIAILVWSAISRIFPLYMCVHRRVTRQWPRMHTGGS